jgi:hypothetical protein
VHMNGAPSSPPCARRAWVGRRDRNAATLEKGRRSSFLFPADVAAAADAAADAAAAVAAADAAAADDEAASATLLRAAPLPLPLPPLLGFTAAAGAAVLSRLCFGRMGRMSDVWRSGMVWGERRALLYQSPEKKKNGRKVQRVHTADRHHAEPIHSAEWEVRPHLAQHLTHRTRTLHEVGARSRCTFACVRLCVFIALGCASAVPVHGRL